MLLGKDTHVLEPFSGDRPIMFLGAAIMPQAIWVLSISLSAWSAEAFFLRHHSRQGHAGLLVRYQGRVLVGIGVQRMVLLSFMISALVGAVGGVILAPITMTSYDVGIMSASKVSPPASWGALAIRSGRRPERYSGSTGITWRGICLLGLQGRPGFRHSADPSFRQTVRAVWPQRLQKGVKCRIART